MEKKQLLMIVAMLGLFAAIAILSFSHRWNAGFELTTENSIKQSELVSADQAKAENKREIALGALPVTEPETDVFEMLDPDSVEVKGFPKLVEIKLGDEAVSREFSSRETLRFPMLSLDNAKAYLNSIKSLAEQGSGPAAFQLHSLLQECSSAARDEVTYRNNEREILQGNKQIHGIGIDDQLLANQTMFYLCESVSDKELEPESLDEWFGLALENGSQVARQQSAASFLELDIAEAGRQFRQLWNSGYTHDGYALSLVYRSTDFDGIDPSKPNLVKAYAYQLATDLINTAALEASGRPEASLLITQTDNARAIATSKMTLQEQREAEQLAANLVKSNTNCCVWIWGVR